MAESLKSGLRQCSSLINYRGYIRLSQETSPTPKKYIYYIFLISIIRQVDLAMSVCGNAYYSFSFGVISMKLVAHASYCCTL